MHTKTTGLNLRKVNKIFNSVSQGKSETYATLNEVESTVNLKGRPGEGKRQKRKELSFKAKNQP